MACQTLFVRACLFSDFALVCHWGLWAGSGAWVLSIMPRAHARPNIVARQRKKKNWKKNCTNRSTISCMKDEPLFSRRVSLFVRGFYILLSDRPYWSGALSFFSPRRATPRSLLETPQLSARFITAVGPFAPKAGRKKGPPPPQKGRPESHDQEKFVPDRRANRAEIKKDI